MSCQAYKHKPFRLVPLIFKQGGNVMESPNHEVDEQHEPDESVWLTAEGNKARVELTDTLVRIIEFKRSPIRRNPFTSEPWDKTKIDKVIEIPRKTITKVDVPLLGNFCQLYVTHTMYNESRLDVFNITYY